MRTYVAALSLVLAACEGPPGPAGPEGPSGEVGETGSGEVGLPGPEGAPGITPWIVGAGVDVTVTSLDIDANGATVAFTLKDAAGKALDRTGTLTVAPVNVAFVLAQLAELPDGSPAQYTSYTTNAAAQAGTETNGTFTTVDVRQGSYTYRFATPLTGFDATKTQTVLAVADRTYDGVRAFDRQTFSVRPMGPAPIKREQVTDASCGGCHGTSLSLHGGRYTGTEQCVMCHTPQSTDPQSGNTVDFKVMVHKIHRGKELPSVKAGTPYQIVGFTGPIDFSTVAWPQNPGFIGKCETCHAGAQADRWKTNMSMAACTSCHDTTIFDGTPVGAQVFHSGGIGPNITDSTCKTCHSPDAVLAPVTTAHYKGLIAVDAPQLELQIQSVTNSGPGQAPTVTFRALENGAPRNLLTSPMTSLRATVAGPNTDFASYFQATIQGTGASGTLSAVDAAQGIFSYAFPATSTISPTATGSFSMGLEATYRPTGATVSYAPLSPTFPFAVTGTTIVPRREIVSAEACNACHTDLSFHGGGRKNANYCVMCHNPNKANDQRVARLESSIVIAEPVDFRVMIHKIHMGEELSQPYVLGGNPAPSSSDPDGNPTDFGEVRYPRPRTDCAACHTSKNWTLPLANSSAYLPSTALELTCSEAPNADMNSYCEDGFWNTTQTIKIQPTTSVCTSCHDQPYTAAHALVNTTMFGVESCATCHGPGKSFDVERVHGIP